MIRTSSYIILCLCLSCFKLLFLKSYVSTDFDVHRNWMSIAYNLPLSDWYFDTTSQWTLDYPPLFAIFELLLAFGGHLLNLDDALRLTSAPIRSESVIVYQKITVILSDIVYFYGVYKLCNSLEPLLCGSGDTSGNNKSFVGTSGSVKNKTIGQSSTKTPNVSDKDGPRAPQQVSQDDKQQRRKSPSPQPVTPVTVSNSKLNIADAIYRPDATSCMATLLLLQPGLLFVDHIHFQYNGLLSGVLLSSVADVLRRRFMAASFWFAILLNLKHIYLYCAPAFGMYLLVSHCLAEPAAVASGGDKQQLQLHDNRVLTFLYRAGRLGSIVISVFAITYTPFATDEAALRQIVARLFPFKRGLTHAYWAPNLWSLYNLTDKILATIFKQSLKVNFDLESISNTKRVTSTSGLVQEYEHLYLPTVKPSTTFLLVGAFIVPIVIKFLFNINRTSARLFLKGLTLTAFTSFMFGWHVHEKAILLVLLPITPLCFTDPQLRATYLRLTLAGTYSLFPLLHQPAEYPVKVCLLLAYYCYASSASTTTSNSKKTTKSPQLGRIKRMTSKLYSLLDKAYVLTLLFNELYIILMFGRLNYDWNPIAGLNKFEFMPLMLTSTLTAAGIATCYLELYYDFVLCTAVEAL